MKQLQNCNASLLNPKDNPNENYDFVVTIIPDSQN